MVESESPSSMPLPGVDIASINWTPKSTAIRAYLAPSSLMVEVSVATVLFSG